MNINDSLEGCGWIMIGNYRPQPPVKPPVNPKVRLQHKIAEHMLSRKLFPIKTLLSYFTNPERYLSIPITAFTLKLVRLMCPDDIQYIELWLDFVGKREPIKVISFFVNKNLFRYPIGNEIFNEVLPDIIKILSGLRFEPRDFWMIARIMVPRWNAVIMHRSQEPIYDYDQQDGYKIPNPFSIDPNFCLQKRQVKRPRIEQFVNKDSQAVEVVEKETNEKRIKKKRE